MLLVILLIEFLVALFDPGKDSGRLFTLLRGERFEQFRKSTHLHYRMTDNGFEIFRFGSARVG